MINKIKQLKNHQGFKKYFANTSWLFGEKILRMGVGLFVGIWVARYLGPEKFGILSYAQAFVGLFSAIATLGLNGITVRELVKHPEQENELLGTAFVLKLIGAVLTLLVLYIAIHFVSNSHYTNILIFIIASAVVFQSFNVIDMYFQAKVMSKYAVFANSFSFLLSSCIKILLISINAPLIAFAWVILFDNFIMASGYVYWYSSIKKDFFLSKIKFSFKLAKNLLQDSWPLIFSSIVIAIYMRIDQVMIKEMLGNKEVGYYSAAVKISEAWYFIPTIISTSLFPAIINAKKHSEELYYERLQKLYNLMVWISLSIALPMTFLSDWIINLLYGQQYNTAGSVLMIYMWASVFIFLLVSSGQWFVAENLTKLALFRNMLGAIVNIILNIYLISIYNIKGAAIATLISYSVAGLFFDFFIKKTRNTFKMKLKALIFYTIRRKIWRYLKDMMKILY